MKALTSTDLLLIHLLFTSLGRTSLLTVRSTLLNFIEPRALVWFMLAPPRTAWGTRASSKESSKESVSSER